MRYNKIKKDKYLKLGKNDRKWFYTKLDSFIPNKIFDAHAHIWTASQFVNNTPEYTGEIKEMTIAKYMKYMNIFIPKREVIGLFMGYPKTDENFDVNLKIANNFLHKELKKNSQHGGLMLISPDLDPEFIRSEIKKLKLNGLKCYHAYSSKRPTFSSDISEYLPEQQVKIANEEGLIIMLHLVKNRVLADIKNQEIIKKYCRKYPNIKLVLAHGGKGYNPYHIFEGISSLKKIDNLWFDCSNVTEVGTIEVIIREMGHKRLLYGSDFPFFNLYEKCIAIGDGFCWLTNNEINRLIKEVDYSDPTPVILGYENLQCMKLAALNLKLNDSKIEDIFYNNAKNIFKV